jgi:hypothetical protein
MDIPEDQIKELKALAPGVARGDEGGFTYFLLPGLQLPEGCSPAVADCLLCPMLKDGYHSRLYFSHVVKSGPNWHALNVHILGRNWNAYSWQTHNSGLSLAQMVTEHLRALR